MESWETTPRIAFLSPEPGSGKTRALEITELLVPRPILSVNMSPAYLFRKMGDEDGLPTILFDEVDTVFGAKAKEHEDLRGLLNAGYRRGAVTGRCVTISKKVETEDIPAFAAVALAGLGDLPDTILTRSVIVRMRRRAPNERVEPYRRRLNGDEGLALRDRLSGWAASTDLSDSIPDMPTGIEDRDADIWEALLVVADEAGDHWPERARAAATELVNASKESTPSLGVQLLIDLRKIFGEHDALSTDSIILKLTNLDESPWSDLRGKPLDGTRMAKMLRQYENVRPKQIWLGSSNVRGYERADLEDAWRRYLPPSLGAANPVRPASDARTGAAEGKPSNRSSGSNAFLGGERVTNRTAEGRNDDGKAGNGHAGRQPHCSGLAGAGRPVAELAGGGSEVGLLPRQDDDHPDVGEGRQGEASGVPADDDLNLINRWLNKGSGITNDEVDDFLRMSQ